MPKNGSPFWRVLLVLSVNTAYLISAWICSAAKLTITKVWLRNKVEALVPFMGEK
jgi:hypothetical protein